MQARKQEQSVENCNWIIFFITGIIVMVLLVISTFNCYAWATYLQLTSTVYIVFVSHNVVLLQFRWVQTKKSLIYGLLGVNHVAMGAMAMGKSLCFVTSMLLCAPLHGLKFVLSPLFF